MHNLATQIEVSSGLRNQHERFLDRVVYLNAPSRCYGTTGIVDELTEQADQAIVCDPISLSNPLE